ncbi:MAG: PspC domain-containing protein, partial [Rhizobacter sp.]|nr:PspC domain-containing protein [Chlorobiales bacterium]
IGLWSLLYHLDLLPSPFFIIDFITDYAEYTLPVAVMICGLYLLVRAFTKPNAAKPVAMKVEVPVEALPVKKLYRVTTHKKVSGVAAGVAAYFGWDVTFTRIAFLLSIPLTQGLAVVFYLALAVILPKDKEIFGKATVKNSDGAEQTVHVQ